MGKLELDLARLSAAELDDQALQEISALLSKARPGAVAAPSLIKLAAAGDLVVARRPCGLQPEIVAVAARLPGAADVVVALDPVSGPKQIVPRLKAELRQARPGASLFRRRDRAPFGFTGAAR